MILQSMGSSGLSTMAGTSPCWYACANKTGSREFGSSGYFKTAGKPTVLIELDANDSFISCTIPKVTSEFGGLLVSSQQASCCKFNALLCHRLNTPKVSVFGDDGHLGVVCLWTQWLPISLVKYLQQLIHCGLVTDDGAVNGICVRQSSIAFFNCAMLDSPKPDAASTASCSFIATAASTWMKANLETIPRTKVFSISCVLSSDESFFFFKSWEEFPSSSMMSCWVHTIAYLLHTKVKQPY